MNSGYFKIKSKTNLKDAPIGHIIQESDVAYFTKDGILIQLEYIEGNPNKENLKIVKPIKIKRKNKNV